VHPIPKEKQLSSLPSPANPSSSTVTLQEFSKVGAALRKGV